MLRRLPHLFLKGILSISVWLCFAGLQAQPADSFLLSPTGLKYQVVETGSTPLAKNGDIVEILFNGRLDNGVRFDGHQIRGGKVRFQLGKGSFPAGFEEGLRMIGAGGKVKLIVPPELGYGKNGIERFVPGNATLWYNTELLSISQAIVPVPYDTTGIKSFKTQGITYYIIKEGIGEQAYANRLCTVHYTGYFEDGRIFDSSVERDEPYKFILGQGQVIGGWDIGIRLMQEGAKYRLIIPPHLAYGKKGSGDIPPNTTLIFDVELIKVDYP